MSSSATVGSSWMLVPSNHDSMAARARRRQVFVSIAVAASWLSASSLIVACSSSSARDMFVEKDASSTVPDEEGAEEPAPRRDAGRPSADPDAGEPEPESCIRTAPSNACGLAPQCGCASSETCDLADLDGNVACVAAGKAPLGAPCTATAGCIRGSTCVFGTCHAFCPTAGKACRIIEGAGADSGTCIQVEGTSDAVIPNLRVCTVKCDPRDARSCGGVTPAGTGVCYVDDDGSTDCQSGGARTVDQTCSSTQLCGPGLVCVTTSSGGSSTDVCRKWCRVGTSDCGGSKQCSGFSPAVKVDDVEHGVCP